MLLISRAAATPTLRAYQSPEGATGIRSCSAQSGKPVPAAIFLGKPSDPRIVCDQWTAEIDRRRDEQAIGGIPMFEFSKPICHGRRGYAQGCALNPGHPDQTLDPRLDGPIQYHASPIDQLSDLPDGYRTDQDFATPPPTVVDQRARIRTETFVPAIEPESDVRIEQECIGQRAISAPVSVSGSSSKIGAIKSTPSATLTEPRWAANKDPFRVSRASSARNALATASVLFPPVKRTAIVSIKATTSGRKWWARQGLNL